MTACIEAAITTAAAYSMGAMGLAVSGIGLKARLDLSKAKHRSLAGHARIARFVASRVPFYQYDEAQIFNAGPHAALLVNAHHGPDIGSHPILPRIALPSLMPQLAGMRHGMKDPDEFTRPHVVGTHVTARPFSRKFREPPANNG